MGTALRGDLANGRFGVNNARSGVEYWVFFPVLANITDSEVSVEHFELDQVDANITVLGYTTFNGDADGSGDIPSIWNTTHLYPPDPPGYNYKERKYRSKLPYTVKARSTSGTVGVARVEVSQAGVSAVENPLISGCKVTYRTGQQVYAQTLGCRYFFE